MKLLIVGVSGMAGHLIATYFKEKNYNITTLALNDPLDDKTMLLNLHKLPQLETFLNSQNFDCIINCTDYLTPICENDRIKTHQLGTDFLHYLEKFYQHTSTKIINLCTDCAFLGQNNPFHKSKFLNDKYLFDPTTSFAEANNANTLTFRTSLIGPDPNPDGIGVLNWFLKQKGTVYGYLDIYWNGITTLELAKAIEAAILQNLCGIYHLVPHNDLSHYDLLALFQKIFHCNLIYLSPQEADSINSPLMNTRSDFNYTLPPYEVMIQELYDWIVQHPSLYPHYINQL